MKTGSSVTSPTINPASDRRARGGPRPSGLLALALVAYAALGSGCQTGIPPGALQLSPIALEQRQQQSRKFENTSERDILIASAAVLQDLGFNIDESETKLGLIAASKNRTAREPYFNNLLTGIVTGFAKPPNERQRIRVTLVTEPLVDAKTNGCMVRVTCVRLIFDINKQLVQVELVKQPEIYRDFYTLLTKSLFLEAQKI
jgi:hypothetical protein